MKLITESEKKFRKELFNSIYERDINTFKSLIKGKNLNFFMDNKTPLMLASSLSKEIAFRLIDAGADPFIQNSEGKTALFYACHLGEISLVRKFYELNSFDVFQDKYSNSLLHISTNSNSCDIVSFLLNLNYDVNIKDGQGKTPLHYAAWHNYNDIVDLLLKHNANVNERDNNGNSPILYVDELETLKLLLDSGANLLKNGKKTLIHNLISKNKKNEINFLHERNIYMKNDLSSNGCNPLIYAVFCGNYTITKTLIEEGYEVNTKNIMGITPLMRAIEKQNLSLIKLLIENGADVHAKNKNGETPFIIACKHNNLDIIKYLFDFNTNLNLQDERGYTALMWAAMYGYKDIVKFLIENDADVTLKNKYNKTALDYLIK